MCAPDLGEFCVTHFYPHPTGDRGDSSARGCCTRCNTLSRRSPISADSTALHFTPGRTVTTIKARVPPMCILCIRYAVVALKPVYSRRSSDLQKDSCAHFLFINYYGHTPMHTRVTAHKHKPSALRHARHSYPKSVSVTAYTG